MNWIKEYIAGQKQKDHLKKKEGIIYSTINNISNEYTPLEQAEIVNRIALGIFDKTKEGRRKHIQVAREYQQGLEQLNLDNVNG